MFRGVSLSLLLVVLGMALFGRSLWFPIYAHVRGARTIAEVVAEYGPGAQARLAPCFERAGLAFPPEHVTLIGLKAERRLELWARADGVEHRIHAWPVLAASGGPGPKLRAGDKQVPEGRYRVAALNPNSSYHLSLRLDYPNAFDAQQAAEEQRAPGGDIFIHGKDRSIGCLAIGDEAIEELLVLVARIGVENVDVILAPHDLRDGVAPAVPDGAPAWTERIYADLVDALSHFR